ncbi:YidE/YbjL duplication [Alkaliphilus pronyensis]|uniref:YidE/YbjL duplication n=1 Tax=Alkaliphilus pronyensis TaxID=1482732 RepID=A0A6I0F268_9FIRM|nr:YidE/YbjL duplication [Alkaliphilus pronyensis]KAB3536077.1 YidE/YbjL duplication [Alkaliphilus pronyensis]
MYILEVLSNPLLLMFLSIFLGHFLGRIDYKNIKLGSSGGLFVGIIISYFITLYLQMEAPNSPLLNGRFISNELFRLSLIGFIASVGLLASKNIISIIKTRGYSFVILAFVITLAGALSSWLLISLLTEDIKVSIIGTYAGALTSSPGLATALESARGLGGNSEAMVGLGYSISYIPGVIAVILFVQLLAKKNKTTVTKSNIIKDDEPKRININECNFCVVSFAFVCIIGILIGNLNIYLGSYLGYFSLGATGGVLISALILGNIKRIGFLNFNMIERQLCVVRDISLNMFLSIVGLNYGYNALNLIRTTGGQLILIGTTTAAISILVGYLVGTKILRLPIIYLIGGICGGMTSTPGLAASIEALDSDEVTAGYGATYPFALFFMILFTNILFKL